MSMVIDGFAYIRRGSIFLFGGFLLLTVAGVLQLVKTRSRATGSDRLRVSTVDAGVPATA